MEQRLAGRHGDGGQQEAGVGQEGRSSRCVGQRFQGAAFERGLCQALRERLRFDVAARQLIDGEQRRRHRHAHLVGQHMRVQVGRQRGQQVCGDRPGGNRKARPGQDRHRDQQRVVGHAVLFEAARFAAGFQRFHQGVVGAGLLLEQFVEGGVDAVLMIAFQQFLHLRIEIALPCAFFQAAGGLHYGLGKHDETLAIGGKLGG